MKKFADAFHQKVVIGNEGINIYFERKLAVIERYSSFVVKRFFFYIMEKKNTKSCNLLQFYADKLIKEQLNQRI